MFYILCLLFIQANLKNLQKGDRMVFLYHGSLIDGFSVCVACVQQEIDFIHVTCLHLNPRRNIL